MRGRGVAAGILVMAATMSVAPATAQEARGGDASLIVVLDPGEDVTTSAPRLAEQHGGRAERVFEHALRGFQFVGNADAAAGLARSPGVAAVVPDEQLELVDVASYGFFRIDAEQSVNDPDGPYRGANTRVAIIDSGVDTDHPDLAPNLDLANGYNCVTPGSVPEDDNGHGTHVAGIAAAAFNPDGYGVVGVAPEASILPLKAFNADGFGSTSWVLCALDRLAQVVAASPTPTALNMSFADTGGDSDCNDGNVSDVLHEALCDVVEAGQVAGAPVVPVAAAGNDDIDAAGTIPAAFHDVITVSGLADHDAERGGLAGCVYVPLLFNYECDDTLASFSNFGTSVDLAAPAVDIYSTVPGGHDSLSGTSMAAPFVTGVVALVLSEHGSLDTAGARSLLLRTGECPDGSAATDESCAGQGSWEKTANHTFFDETATEPDPDGVPEPVVNAGRAAAEADLLGNPPDAPPTITITNPAAGSVVSGTVTITGTAVDDVGIASVEVLVDGAPIGQPTPAADGTWTQLWDTTLYTDGPHSISAVATDTANQTASGDRSVTVDNAPAPTNTMHIGEISGSSTSGRKWTASAYLRVVDEAGLGVAGATIVVDPDTSGRMLSCITGPDGRCSVSTRTTVGSVRFTVTGVTKSGWTHDSAADADGDTTTSATDVVVTRA